MSADARLSLAGRKLSQIALTVTDLARAIAFYRDALGLSLLFEVPPGMAFFDLGNGTRLLIGNQVPDGWRPGGAVLYFDAPDLPALAATLEARGVVFPGPAITLQKQPAGDLMLREFRDPDGNALALLGLVAR